jgi:hypothetical protein
MPPTRPRLGRLLAILVLPALLLGATATPAAAATPRATGPADASDLTINAFIWECVAYGDGVPEGASVTGVTVKRKNGTTVAVDDVSSDAGGWSMATVCDGKGKGAIRPGDTIRVTLSDASFRTFTVPDLLASGDPSTGRLGGKAPEGGALTVTLRTCDGSPDSSCDTLLISDGPSFDAGDGAWSWVAPEFSMGDMKRTVLTGLDRIEVGWRPNAGEYYEATSYDATYLARIGSPIVTGYGRLGSKVTVTLRTANGAVRAKGTTTVKGFRGAWAATLKRDGKKVAPRRGDIVTASIVAKGLLKLRTLALTVDPDMPTLRGRCWPARYWSVRLPDLSSAGAWTELDGTFALNFVTLPAAGTKLGLRCAAMPGAIQAGTWTMPAS